MSFAHAPRGPRPDSELSDEITLPGASVVETSIHKLVSYGGDDGKVFVYQYDVDHAEACPQPLQPGRRSSKVIPRAAYEAGEDEKGTIDGPVAELVWRHDFSHKINSVTLSGDTLAVGAYGEDSNQTTITNGTTASADNSNEDSGAAYVFVLQ